ncbi:complement factor H-like [Mantella aurantiaca]
MPAPWFYLLITVCLLHQLSAGDNSPSQEVWCKKPAIENMRSLSKEYYQKGEEVTVQCYSGYYSSSDTMRCDNPGTPQEWTPPNVTCTVWCKKPAIENMQSLSKEYYQKGEEVTVQCYSGYNSSSSTMRCDNPGTPQEWTPPNVTCTALCKKPAIENMESVWKYKEYYYNGEEVTVQCNSGYYPLSFPIVCTNPGTLQEWTPPNVTCTEVTMMHWTVTSTSISVWISCSPECPDTWRFSVEHCPEPYNSRTCKTSHGKNVTFTDLQPSTKYILYPKIYINKKEYNPESKEIWTAESALCKKPDETILTMDPKKIFYNIGDKVTVKCLAGYRPSPSTVQCKNYGTSIEWNSPPQCIALCKKPDETILTMDPEKTFYDIGDTVRVWCPVGYRPSPSTVECENHGTSIEWNSPPQCIAQCTHPTIPNMRSISEYKEYYKKGEKVKVRCNSGFYPSSSSTMRCDNPGTAQEWTRPNVTCIALCKKPDETILTMEPEKTFYNIGDTVTTSRQTSKTIVRDLVDEAMYYLDLWRPGFCTVIGNCIFAPVVRTGGSM